MSNESTYIPIGAKHRLRNPGHVLLGSVEMKVDGYLDEDDIVRFSNR